MKQKLKEIYDEVERRLQSGTMSETWPEIAEYALPLAYRAGWEAKARQDADYVDVAAGLPALAIEIRSLRMEE